jgi:hypothetical protein
MHITTKKRNRGGIIAGTAISDSTEPITAAEFAKMKKAVIGITKDRGEAIFALFGGCAGQASYAIPAAALEAKKTEIHAHVESGDLIREINNRLKTECLPFHIYKDPMTGPYAERYILRRINLTPTMQDRAKARQSKETGSAVGKISAVSGPMSPKERSAIIEFFQENNDGRWWPIANAFLKKEEVRLEDLITIAFRDCNFECSADRVEHILLRISMRLSTCGIRFKFCRIPAQRKKRMQLDRVILQFVRC